MALTKVTGNVVKTTTDLTINNLTGVAATFTGNVSVGGTLTYEDVTSIEAVGIITAKNNIDARKDVLVGAGVSVVGVITATSYSGSGASLTALNASNIGSGTVPTARLGSGTANNSVFLRGDSSWAAVTQTTINNNADNRVITGSGTANTLEGEANLTYDGTALKFASSQSKINLNTSDGSDNKVLSIHGGGDSSQSRGAGLSIYGNEYTNYQGKLFVMAGNSGNANGTIDFYTGGSERLRIDSSGKLGLGVASPASESGWGNILHINSASAGAHIRFTDDTSGSGAGDGSYIGHYGNDTYLVNKESSGVIIFNTNSAERLRIDSNGRVNIGQASDADHILNVADTNNGTDLTAASSCGIQLQNKSTTDNTFSFIEWRNAGGGRIGRIAGVQEDANGDGCHLSFLTEPTSGGSIVERLRINSDGRVLIGHTSARVISTTVNAYLQLEGTTFHQSAISVTRNTNDAYGSYFILGKSRGTSVGSNSTLQDGDTIGEIRFAGSDGSDMVSMTALIKSVVDGTPGTDDMPGALTFNTTADGAATTTERLRIDSGGRTLIGGTTSSRNEAKLQVHGTSDTNYIVMQNTSASDADGNRYGKFIYRGTQSGGEVTDLVHLVAAHDGSADDQKGMFIVKCNDGSDGTSPTETLRVYSSGDIKVNTGRKIYTGNSQGQLTVQGGATYPGGAIKFAGGQSGATDQGTIIFYSGTATSLEERLRIHSDGKLTVGKDNQSSATFTQNLDIRGRYVNAVGDFARLMFRNSTDSGNSSASIRAERSGDNYGTNLTFWTQAHGGGSGGDGLERLRISKDGEVGILGKGVSATAGANEITWPTAAPLHVKYASNNSGSSSGTYGIYLEDYVGSDLSQQETYIAFALHDDNSNGRPQVKIGAEVGQRGDANSTAKEGSGSFVVYTTTGNSTHNDQSTEKFVVKFDGNASLTGSLSQGSDIRLKDNVATISGALNKVKQLRGVQYTWNSTAVSNIGFSTSIGTQLGVIADEIESVVPEVVIDNGIKGRDETFYKAVEYDRLVPVLIEAVKELTAKVEALESS